jgi:hypothetical protein
MEKLEKKIYRAFPTSPGEIRLPSLSECIEKINQLIDFANESQKRDKQVRSAIKLLAMLSPDIENLRRVNQILNSTKE